MRQIGVIAVDGHEVGVILLDQGVTVDTFTPDLSGYMPQGRAEAPPRGMAPDGQPSHVSPEGPHKHGERPSEPEHNLPASPPEKAPQRLGAPVATGSAATSAAIAEAAKAHHLDPNFMRAVASIESGMNPASNAHRATQYKGLYQMGTRGQGSEWSRFGNGGNVYSASANAMAAARSFAANRAAFEKHFHRAPTEAEMYMMHQQGLGFFTRGTMTNISGNLPPKARANPYYHTHKGFEEFWGHEIARRKAQFTKQFPESTQVAGPSK